LVSHRGTTPDRRDALGDQKRPGWYSVPDRTRRVVEVHQLADEIQIFDAGRLVAVHPVLEGRRLT
jgi:hypothetical protein